MISTGNDIVSIDTIDVIRTKQPGFYSKILSETEKTLYQQPEFSTIPLENFVWLLWSIKESAYKYLQRLNPEIVFSPTKFVVTQLKLPLNYSVNVFNGVLLESVGFDEDIIKGIVTFGEDTLYSRSLIYDSLICSVVNHTENFEKTGWGIKLIDDPHPDNQSFAVREFIISRLGKLYKSDGFSIGKRPDGCPYLLKDNLETNIPVSISHHNRIVAYSFVIA